MQAASSNSFDVVVSAASHAAADRAASGHWFWYLAFALLTTLAQASLVLPSIPFWMVD